MAHFSTLIQKQIRVKLCRFYYYLLCKWSFLPQVNYASSKKLNANTLRKLAIVGITPNLRKNDHPLSFINTPSQESKSIKKFP